MKLRITAFNQLRVLSFHLSGLVIMLVALYLLKFNNLFVISFGAVFVFLTLPLLYLHIEYYIANRKQSITIKDEVLTVITRNRNIYKFEFSDLSVVILYKSAGLDTFGIQRTPMESYHFARIITKSGKQIIITCLMSHNLEKVVDEFKGLKKIRKKCTFCTLSKL